MAVHLSVEAILTSTALAAIARGMDPEIGRSFIITSFILGDQGADPDDPQVAQTPDVATTDCMGNVFGPKAITSPVFYINDVCPVFRCEISGIDYTGVVSSVCLVAEYVFSLIPNDPLVGQTFTAAVATRPELIIADTDDLILDVAVQS